MPYNRLVIDGTLGNGVEAFSVGLNFAGPGETALESPTSLSAWADAVLGLWAPGTGWAGATKGMLAAGGKVERVRTYHYATVGGAATSAGTSSVAGQVGSGTVTMPPQCALAVSLLTGIPGRRTRGRFYWPCLTLALQASLRLTTTTSLATRATDFATMLRDIANASTLTPELNPVVVSAAGNFITPVISVRVGDVIDTQRRRRDALVENYGTAVIP